MKKVKKLIYYALIVVTFVFVGIVVDDCTDDRKEYMIGVSQCYEDDWHDKFNKEVMMMSYLNDSVDVCIKSSCGDSRKQSAQIDSLVNMGVDVLIVVPNDEKDLAPAIEKAYDRGIPVVLFEKKIKSGKYTAFIGCSNYNIGKHLGMYIADKLEGKGRVAEICGPKTSKPSKDRHKGFVDALKSYPGVNIVSSEHANWEQDGATKAMERILKRTHDLDYVFAHNDRMAYAAYLAARKAGMNPMPKFVGVDGLMGEHGGVSLVYKGVLDASYLNPTGGEGVMKLAVRILGGEPVKKENTLATAVITKDNAELTTMTMQSMENQRTTLETLHHQVLKYEKYNRAQELFLCMLAMFLIFVIVSAVSLYRAYMEKKKLSVSLSKKNSDLKRLNDEVVELTQSRLAFFTNVSHELRTPLTLIVDPVKQILENSKLDLRTRTLLSIIERNALALQRIVDDIMDFRKIQSGKMELKLKSFDLVESLKQWTLNFYPLAEKKGIRLLVNTDKFTHRSIVADVDKVARMVLNLLSNALKYTDEGGTVTVTLSDAADGKLQLSVEDTGHGISEEEQSKVFERFFQAKNSEGGTGIGLAIVKANAELHNGTVTVKSQLGKGTTFSILLPCSQELYVENGIIKDDGKNADGKTAAEADAADAAAAESKRAAEDSKPTLLVVDDNHDIREYISNVFAEDYIVLTATNGQEAFDLALKYVPDIVVCDVMMPVMDGVEFCKKLKETTAICHIPVLLLTAKNMEEHKIDGYEHGADSYITKPFSSKLLKVRIENLLRSRKMLGVGSKTDPLENVDNSGLSQADKEFMERLYDIIHNYMSDSDFGVEAIGKHIGLSRVQLYRKVKALTGLSAVDLLRKSRLHKSKTLLEKTSKGIAEIAYEVGFSSPSYFTKCFKDEYEMLPGDVRNK
ncbi:substrate-binding domain-containing protein [Prevotella sp.]|uniref:substrate-binding domain-containing protein n=1 Tax=Prevotella sp. TaxID=59823 RepID=UPI00308038B1